MGVVSPTIMFHEGNGSLYKNSEKHRSAAWPRAYPPPWPPRSRPCLRAGREIQTRRAFRLRQAEDRSRGPGGAARASQRRYALVHLRASAECVPLSVYHLELNRHPPRRAPAHNGSLCEFSVSRASSCLARTRGITLSRGNGHPMSFLVFFTVSLSPSMYAFWIVVMDLLNRSHLAFSTAVDIFLFPSVARTSTTHSVPEGSRITAASGRAPRLGRRFMQLRFRVTHTVPVVLFRSYILVSSVRKLSFSRIMAKRPSARNQP